MSCCLYLCLREGFLFRVVLERPFEDDHGAIHELGLGGVRILFGLFARGWAIVGAFHEAFFNPPRTKCGIVPAARELPDFHYLRVIGVNLRPIPFRARQVAFGRELGTVRVVAADINAAAFGRFHNHFRAIHVAGQHIRRPG